MRQYAGYVIAFVLGVIITLVWPDGDPKLMIDPKLQAHEKELLTAVDSLQNLVIVQETTIDNIKIELTKDSVIINSKIIDRHEEVTFINNATVSDDFRWLTNRYRWFSLHPSPSIKTN